MSLVTNPEVAAHEFALMLALSTAHMSPRTAADWMPQCPWACFAKGEWGWFMYVCDDVGVTEAADVLPRRFGHAEFGHRSSPQGSDQFFPLPFRSLEVVMGRWAVARICRKAWSVLGMRSRSADP